MARQHNIFRSLFSLIEKWFLYILDHHIIKVAFFLGYIFTHFVFIYIETKNINKVIYQIMSYELFWYIAILLMVIFPYIIKKFVIKKINQQSVVGLYEPWKKNSIYSSYLVLAFIVLCTVIYGFITDANTLFFVYGKVYAIVLYFLSLFFLGPCLFNMFYVILSYWDDLKNLFEDINDKETLLKRGPILISSFKSMNILLGTGYSLYLIMVLISFFTSGFITKMLIFFENRELNYDFIMGLLYILFPILLPSIYYLLTTRNIKRYLFSALIRTMNSMSSQELENVKYIFYNKDSSFRLGGLFSYYISPILIASGTSILQIILDKVLQ